MNTYLKFRYPFFSLILLLTGVFWIWLSSDIENERPDINLRAPQVGLLAPDFSLFSINGDQFELEDLIGSPIILNFWASWCPPCRAEMPDFQQAHLDYIDDEIYIIAINSTNQDTRQHVLSFVDNHRLTFPILLDSSGSVTDKYNVHSLPTTFFIDRTGEITRVLIGGPIPLSLMRVEINKLLQE